MSEFWLKVPQHFYQIVVLIIAGQAIALFLTPLPDIPACLPALHSSKLCGYENFTGCVGVAHRRYRLCPIREIYPVISPCNHPSKSARVEKSNKASPKASNCSTDKP